MRHYFYVLFLLLPLLEANAQQLVYPDSVIRGGALKQGESRRVNFKVRNVSDSDAYLVVHKSDEHLALDTLRYLIPAKGQRIIFMRFQAPAKAGLLEIPVIVEQVFPSLPGYSPITTTRISDSLPNCKKLYLRAAVSNESNVVPSRKTHIAFDKMSHDFGTIPLGPLASCRFVFVNRDSLPLMIEKVKTNCGCLSARYSYQAIAPGASAEIEFYYHTENRPGHFTQGANIQFNSGVGFYVSFTGAVESEAEMLRFR